MYEYTYPKHHFYSGILKEHTINIFFFQYLKTKKVDTVIHAWRMVIQNTSTQDAAFTLEMQGSTDEERSLNFSVLNKAFHAQQVPSKIMPPIASKML